MGFTCLKAAEPLRGDSLFFTTQFPGLTGTHLIDLGRIKGWVKCFWTCDPWIGNSGYYPPGTSQYQTKREIQLKSLFSQFIVMPQKVLWTFKKTQRSVKIKIQVYFHFNTTFWNAIGGERFLLKDFLWEHLNT